MREIESEGKTVADAVDAALKQLGLRREQVEVLVLQEPSAGILGFGAKPARVKLSEKFVGTERRAQPRPQGRGERGVGMPRRSGDYPPAELPSRPAPQPAPRSPREERRPSRDRGPERGGERGRDRQGDRGRGRDQGRSRQGAPQPRQPAREPQAAPRPQAEQRPKPAPLTGAQTEAAVGRTQELLKQLLGLMLFEDAKVAASWDPKQERVKASVETAASKRLIGPEGRTLDSLQFLVTLIVGRRVGVPVAVQVDCEGYWASRENAILDEALKGVEAVKSTGKPVRLSPMDAQMRRLIHRSLADQPGITTSSEGDGAWRKIVLRPSP